MLLLQWKTHDARVSKATVFKLPEGEESERSLPGGESESESEDEQSCQGSDSSDDADSSSAELGGGGGGITAKGAAVKKTVPYLNPDAIQRWCGKETITDVWIEGEKCKVLLDGGSQVNQLTASYVSTHNLMVHPLSRLVEGSESSVSLEGVGGMKLSVKGFVVVNVQFPEVQGYNEEVVALVVPDSDFGNRVPFIAGTPILERAVEVMKETEIDKLATPWAQPWQQARIATLLAREARVANPGPPPTAVKLARAVEIPPFATKVVSGFHNNKDLACRKNVLVSNEDPQAMGVAKGINIEPA